MEDSGVPEVHQFVHGLAEGPLTSTPHRGTAKTASKTETG